MYRFEKENQDLFIALASILNTKGAGIDMESDFEHWKQHHEIKYTNVPYIGGGFYSGTEGFYFKKQGYQDWSIAEEEVIKSTFPINIDGYKFELIDFQQTEYDDDRVWAANFGFIITRDGQNVLK